MDDLRKKTVVELQEIAKKAKIRGRSKMRKQELIEALSKVSQGSKNTRKKTPRITTYAVEPPPVEYFDYSDTDILPDALSVEECFEADEEED